jgi:hypothetical protein
VAQAVRDRGNVIRFNKILDTIGYGSYPHCTHPPRGFGSPFCSWGIYLDASISGVTVYGNVIARSGANSLFIQFGGGNVVENNIFVETSDQAIELDSVIFFGWFMHSDTQGRFPEPPNEIRRNIFYYTSPKKKLYQTGLWGHPEWNAKQAVWDSNLIWHQGLPIEVELDPKRTYQSFADWQAAGHDQQSVVADPLFVDAPHECWICPTQLDVDSAHKRRRLLDKGRYPETWWNVDIYSDGRIQMELADADKQTGTTISAGAVRQNAWNHVTIVVDRRNFQTRYYLNGRLDSSRPLPAAFRGHLDMADKSLTTGIWQPFVGLLGELKIYRRALTEQEIRSSYEPAKQRYASVQFTAEPD